MSYRLLPLLVCAFVLAGTSHAEIYTWKDAQGVRHFSDSARAGHAKRADLPGLQSTQGDPGALNRLRAQQAEAAGNNIGAPNSRTPEIVQPKPEATIRDAKGVVPISMTIGGGSDLRAGEQITYYLDGSPIPESPTDETRLQLGNVPRGTHTLSAALLYQGRELRRTAPVTFYMKPPAAISPLNTNQGGGGENGTARPPGATVAPPAGNAAGVPAAPRFNTHSTAAGSS